MMWLLYLGIGVVIVATALVLNYSLCVAARMADDVMGVGDD